jgi:transcriptional regulator with XRE-family HTH domain
MRVREFLTVNHLKQRELANFLSVTEAAISNVVKGKSEFSKENLIKILNNPYGWDVSMLTEESRDSKPELVAEQKPQLSNVEILLRDMLAEKEAKIDALQERINELIEENARLKTLIEGERKGGVA